MGDGMENATLLHNQKQDSLQGSNLLLSQLFASGATNSCSSTIKIKSIGFENNGYATI
jgi:hypothetical protein